MNCPKCGAEVNKINLREDGCLVCPGCATVYRRKKTSLQSQSMEQARKALRETAGRLSERQTEKAQADGLAIRSGYHNFDFPAVLMAVLALLCFVRAYSVRLGFFCILGGILLVVYTIRINSLSQIAVVVPVILILIKEIFHHQIWSGLWPTILLIILTIIIWAADANLLKVKDSTFSVLGIIRFVLALITTFLCAYNFVRRMTGFTQLVSTYEYSVYEFGMLFMEIALLEIFGPWEKYSGRIRGSMIIVVAGLYLAAIVLCCIGFALAENFQEAVSTLNEGANLFGDYLMNYALQEAGEGISMGFLKTMLAISIAVICEGFALVSVNFQIHRKNRSFYKVFVFDAILVIISLVVLLIGTKEYIAGAIVAVVMTFIVIFMARYFRTSPTVRKYFET